MKHFSLNLNEDWLLSSGNGQDGAAFHKNGLDAATAVKAWLPSLSHMFLEDHVGISFYQKTFFLNELPTNGQCALLRFDRADMLCEVGVNGCVIGTHFGSEEPFEFDVTKCLTVGENRITVRISKPHAEDVDGYSFSETPHSNVCRKGLFPGKRYNETGMPGSVMLVYLPRLHVTDLYLAADAASGEITVETTLGNATDASCRAEMTVLCKRFGEGEVLAEETLPVEASVAESVHRTVIRLERFSLWDVDDPNLYEVDVALKWNGECHRVSCRTGFRSFLVGEDGYFYLNGKRIFLKSSHTGNCMPGSTHHVSSHDPELIRKDFLMAKAVGFNMVRFISGVALPVQLDLCDEIGLMVYEEPLSSWNQGSGDRAEEIYQHYLCAMVKRDRSHPCVTVWGLLNEMPMKDPFGQVTTIAYNSLSALRALDRHRLVLYSSGRWDEDLTRGSVSNPESDTWQYLWNAEGHPEASLVSEPRRFKVKAQVGDVHFYPCPVPISDLGVQYLTTVGHEYRRPVFISEIGIGSLLDTVTLTRQFEAIPEYAGCPDAKKIKEMNDRLLAALKQYGFDRYYAFPSELMAASMRNHAFYRRQLFDLMRSNPYINGISCTGLLDHSICGEGLFTLFRHYKTGIADVLQDGFSKLRWCTYAKRTSLFCGERLSLSISLANEDVLEIGRTYPIRIGIFSEDGATIGVSTHEITVTEELAKGFSIPVFCGELDTEALDEGSYRVRVELAEGAYAEGGVLSFSVFAHRSAAQKRRIFVRGVGEDTVQLLENLGFETEPFELSKLSTEKGI